MTLADRHSLENQPISVGPRLSTGTLPSDFRVQNRICLIPQSTWQSETSRLNARLSNTGTSRPAMLATSGSIRRNCVCSLRVAVLNGAAEVRIGSRSYREDHMTTWPKQLPGRWGVELSCTNRHSSSTVS